MNAEIISRWEEWNRFAVEDPDLLQELSVMKDQEKIMEDAFYRDLEFGTGGLRGVIGAGTNRMNIYTVARASQGYADYLNAQNKENSVAIAYDSRIKSDRFARVAAEVFAANQIRVFIYPELMPTPSLSFAVRYLHCRGGVVVTASHNPAKYNGYKVYGADGCQITSKAAKEILASIEAVDIFSGVKKLSFEEGINRGLISYIGSDVVEAYLEAVSAQSLRDPDMNTGNISVVYTPLNGTGLKCVTSCLRKNGFADIYVVPEQEKPDGNFPTCPYPNPEIREALDLGIRNAQRLESDLVLATDPDCDRVGIAVKTGSDYALLTGNEVGMLLLDYICRRRIAMGKMPADPVAVKTIVTIDMAKRIAESYGVQMLETLTGFKYIGEQIGLLEARGEENRFILGFEESYGYLSGAYVRDKDAVNASLLICEMASWYKNQGRTLADGLEAIYNQYGYCLNTLHSYQFEGAKGFETMQSIMSALRDHGPKAWAGHSVLSVSDYKASVTCFADGRKEPVSLPKSNVLKYVMEGNLSLVVRPSGTEPKLKVYFSVCAETREQAAYLEQKMAEEMETYFS